MAFPPTNQRKHTRVPTDLKCFLFIDGQKYTGKVSNISLSGAFFADVEPEISPVHTSHSGVLKIFLNDELLLLKCEVVYAVARGNPSFMAGAGVAFDEEDTETHKSIIKLAIAYHLC
jgi:hypothetical protein